MERFDIVDLIEKNPITRLSKNYQNSFIEKIKNHFCEEQQRLFVANFYCYLNFKDNEFVINLDDVWKWIGFTRNDSAKKLLEKHFKIDIDYKVFAPPIGGAKNTGENRGGHNKEKIILTIDTFKSFCMAANTDKSKNIKNYYIKMEKLVTETFDSELSELKIQLEKNNKQKRMLEDKLLLSEVEKELEREKALIEKFPKNTQCIYYGKIDNKSEFNENLIKFGNSNDLPSRIKNHKKTYSNFILLNAFKVPNQLESENIIKKHKILSHKLRKIDGKEDNKFTELIAYNDSDFTLEDFNKILLDIVSDSDCTINKELEMNRIDLEKTKQLTIIEQEKTKQMEITQQIESQKTKQSEIELANNIQLAMIDEQKFKLIELELKNNTQLAIIEQEKTKQMEITQQTEKEKTKQTQAIAGNSRPINNTIIYNNSQEIIDNGQNEAFTFNKFLEESITFVADNKSFIKRDDLYKCYFEWITTKYDRPVIVPSNGGKFSILINSKLKDFYKRTGPKHIEIIDENNNVTYKDGRYWRLINHKFIESPPVYESTN